MDVTSAQHWIRQGMQFIAIGSELRFMTSAAQEAVEALKGKAESKDIAY